MNHFGIFQIFFSRSGSGFFIDSFTFKIMPDRNLASTEHVFFLDMDFWGLAVLRDWSVVDLAKTGDSQKQMLLYEAGLVSKNEKSSGILADCKA